jgi:hypothetical protein
MKLIIEKDTYIKALPLQTTDLLAQQLVNGLIAVKAGQSIEIAASAPYEGAPNSGSDDHLYVQLAEPLNDCDQLRWFVYGLHAKIEGTEHDNNPVDKPAVRAATPTIIVPGISIPVGVHQPVYRGCNFSWAELTKGGSRIPVDETVTQRIVKLCTYLDGVREFLGNRPIRITSGYRDPQSNRAVGGASDSRHMYGDAVDFWVEGLDVVDVFEKLKGYHPRGGLAVGNGFVHIDLRPGPPARWAYPGGPRVNLW